MPEPHKTRHQPHPLPRRLHLSDGEWSYQIGDHGVRIRCPDLGKTTYVHFGKMTSTENPEADHPRITPAAVINYIEANREQLLQ